MQTPRITTSQQHVPGGSSQGSKVKEKIKLRQINSMGIAKAVSVQEDTIRENSKEYTDGVPPSDASTCGFWTSRWLDVISSH